MANTLINGLVTNDPKGYRTVHSDNRYTSFELAIYIREKLKILTVGTVRKIMKGFDKKLFDMDLNNSG